MATRANSGECNVCGDILATNSVDRLIKWLQQHERDCSKKKEQD